jgi:hypothetical protein
VVPVYLNLCCFCSACVFIACTSIADSAADLQKKDRAAFAGGPSQGGNALGEGSDSGGYRSPLIFRMEKSRALTDLNFDRAGD